MNFGDEVSKIKSLVAQPTFANSTTSPGKAIDEIKQRLHPHELAYIIDCRTGDVEAIQQPRTKGLFDIKDSASLYEDVHRSYMEDNLKFTQKIISTYNSILDFSTETRATSFYKSTKGHIILKTTFAPILENGRIRYTAGILQNLFNDVSITGLNYRFLGPSADQLYDGINKFESKNNILSGREIQILKMIKEGNTNKQIGFVLSLSEHTIRTHRRNIIFKLGTSGTLKALKKAEEFGILA